MTYFICLVEQALVSLLNIGLNIWLIRVGGSDLFGVFAFWFSVCLLAGSVQYGLVICHLAPLPPGPGTMAQRLGPERAMFAASLASLAIAGIAVAVAIAIGGAFGLVSTPDAPGAIAMVPAYLAYQYARALAFSRGALITATLATAATLALIVLGLAWAGPDASGLSAGRMLLIAAVAYGVAGGATLLHLGAGLQCRLRHLRAWLPYAAISRWSLIGIVCFETMNRAPGFAVTGWLGAAALGRMSSTQMPSRPPIIAVAAILPALRNTLARLRDHRDWEGFALQIRRGCLAAACGNALWAVPLGLAWPLLSRLAFHGRFADDLALALLWTASQLLSSVAAVVAMAFQVCGAFRQIGYADLFGAGVTLVGLVLLLPPFGIPGTILAIMVGQACYLAMLLAQWSRLRDAHWGDVHAGPALISAADA